MIFFLFAAYSAPAAAAPEQEQKALKVLFIGDSIATSSNDTYIGYSRHIEKSHPDWDVRRFVVYNSEGFLNGIKNRGAALRGYDVIYMNTGLHSLRQDSFEDLETYEKNLTEGIDFLLGIEDLTFIWSTTIPIAERASGGRKGSMVPVYNEVSLRIMAQRDIIVDDLYKFLLPYYEQDSSRGGEYLAADGTHWNTRAQREIIAPHIAEFISAHCR